MGIYVQVQTIESNSLLLRSPEAKDLDNFVLLATHPSFNKFNILGPMSKEAAEGAFKFLIAPENQRYKAWMVFLKPQNVFIGFVGYYTISFEKQPIEEVLLEFLDKYWETEFPTEALKLASEYAFSHNVPKLTAFVNPININTILCYDKLGCKLEKKVDSILGVPSLVLSLEKH